MEDSNRLFEIKSRLLTGEFLDKKTIEDLVALSNKNDNQKNHLNSRYVELVLKEEDKNLKVYSKNSKFENNSAAGFVIYTFNRKMEDAGKIKDNMLFLHIVVGSELSKYCSRNYKNGFGNLRHANKFFLPIIFTIEL